MEINYFDFALFDNGYYWIIFFCNRGYKKLAIVYLQLLKRFSVIFDRLIGGGKYWILMAFAAKK